MDEPGVLVDKAANATTELPFVKPIGSPRATEGKQVTCLASLLFPAYR
jgi:hypothetical protein